MPPFLRAATALAAALLALPAPHFAHAGAGCAAKGPALPDGWAISQPAPFAAGGSKITVLAVAPRHPDTMLVTNGAAIQRTADAGCSWQRVTLPDTDVLGVLGGITGGITGGGKIVTDIEIGPVRKGTEPVWVLAQQTGPLSHPAVFSSTDGGATFTGSGVGLPPTGHGDLLAASADPAIAYAVVDLPSPAGRRLFVTKDNGNSWTASTTNEFGYDSLLVDTVASDHLWAWQGDRLAQSFDGGATFIDVKLPVKLPIRDVALGQAARGSRVAVLVDGGTLLRTDDGGVSWSRERVRPAADSVSAAPDLDVAAVAGPGVVTILPSIFSTIDVPTRNGEGDPLDLTIGLLPSNQVRLAGRADYLVLVHEGTVLKDLPGASAISLNAPSLVIPIHPALLPDGVTVTLKPGEKKDVTYELDVPADPSPIDVFFLIDTTGSMGGVIDGVRTGLARIVNDLSAAGIPARFGVGEVKDYPFQPWSVEPDLPYRLFRKVGPVDKGLLDALNRLQASGGGDEAEAMTTGLYQMASGTGQTVNGQVMVPRHADAGFRPGALHIALESTDAPFHKEPDYPGPDLEAVYAALRAAHVNVVGLSAGSPAHADLADTAEATHTLAPAGGVDCNGDGKNDLDPGDPLVCSIDGGGAANLSVDVGGIKVDTSGTAGIGSAIVALLRGIKDPAALRVTSSAPDVVKVLSASAPSVVDMKLPHRETFRARIACPAARYGSNVGATMTGSAGARTVATAGVTVRCLAPAVPAPAAEQFLVTPPRPPVGAAAAPPGPPPAPVQNLNPNANPNPNPNAQTQAGAAQQRQEQYQLALATGHFEPDADTELAMSDHRAMAPLAPYGAAGLMFAASAAYAVRSRTRTRVARAYRSS
jgi:photosystem II stability/assembly factor-like uncharacterized protein